MKTRKFLLLILLVCVTAVLSYQAASWKSDQAFLYPDIAGVSSSIGKRRCRVSEEEAQNMTTRALVETVMTYPNLVDMYAFDYPDLWFRSARELPMFQELLSREDGLEVLKKEAEKVKDARLRQLDYQIVIGCIERATKKP